MQDETNSDRRPQHIMVGCSAEGDVILVMPSGDQIGFSAEQARVVAKALLKQANQADLLTLVLKERGATKGTTN